MSERPWWEVLSCSPTDDLDAVRQRYKVLAQLFHPDRVIGATDAVRHEAAHRMVELNDAWAEAKEAGNHGTREERPQNTPAQGPTCSGVSRGGPDEIRGYRHPNGAAWVESELSRHRGAWGTTHLQPGQVLDKVQAYVRARSRWAELDIDREEGWIKFRARRGGRTWTGQEMLLWLEPEPAGMRVFVLGRSTELVNWREAEAIAIELLAELGILAE